MAHNRSYLAQLPQNIIQDEVSSHLDKQAIGRFCQTSKRMYQLFQVPSAVARLLHFVREANYLEAEKMVMADPLLMFKYVSYQKADGTDETISPLKFAFKVFDTHMWCMFLEYIKKNFEYMKRFAQQFHEQTEHIHLEPLLTAYDTYEKQFFVMINNNNNKISDQEIEQAWLAIGQQQRAIFIEARHLLKEFCRQGYTWRPFNVTGNPRLTTTDLKLCNYHTFYNESVLFFTPDAGLGFEFTLLRGIGILPTYFTPNRFSRFPHPDRFLDNDRESFRQLYLARCRDDLGELRSYLAQFFAVANTQIQPKCGIRLT